MKIILNYNNLDIFYYQIKLDKNNNILNNVKHFYLNNIKLYENKVVNSNSLIIYLKDFLEKNITKVEEVIKFFDNLILNYQFLEYKTYN